MNQSPEIKTELNSREEASNRTTNPEKPRKKRRWWKVLLLLAVLTAAAVFGVLLLDELGIDLFLIGDFAEYTYVRWDGAAVMAEDIAAIQPIVQAREAEVSPGSRGYGVPRFSLRDGALLAKVRSNMSGEKQMRYLMSGGMLRLLDAELNVILDGPNIVASPSQWRTGSTDRALRLHLGDEAVQRLRAADGGFDGKILVEYDGDVIFEFQYDATTMLDGDILQLPYGVEGDIKAMAAAINHPMALLLKDVTVRPTPAPAQTATPASEAQPTPTATAPELLEGETYYLGTAKLNDCDGVTVGFVLAADQSEIHSITFTLTNLSVTTTSGNTRTTTRVGAAITTLSGAHQVEAGKVTVSAGAGTKLTLSGLDTGQATGTLQYTYHSYGSTTQSIDLGSAPITMIPQTEKEQ